MNERPVMTRIRRILNTEDRSMKLTLPEVLGLFAAATLGENVDARLPRRAAEDQAG